MFVEYMAVQNKKEAEKLFEMSLQCAKEDSDSEKFKIYKAEERSGYVFSLRSGKKKKEKHKWNISLEEKGVCAKRMKTSAYLCTLILTLIFGFLCALSIGIAVCIPKIRILFIWGSMLFFLLSIYQGWAKLFRPGVALKIYLIRML